MTEKIHNLLLVILDMFLLLAIFFLGVNAMIWTQGQITNLRNKCCEICLSQAQGKKTFNSNNTSNIDPILNISEFVNH